MMNNLFSIFDPSSFLLIQINWISLFVIFLIIPLSMWLIPTRNSILIKNLILTLHNEFKNLLSQKMLPNMTIIPISIFFTILLNNSLGLFPFIFTASSHLTFSLTLALPLWLSFMIFGWISSTNHMLAHLVPQGTPVALMSFMVCIELVSNIIRPITLSVRLAANMIAGHLLMTLLGNMAHLPPLLLLLIIIITQCALLTLECAVAFIQSYVFAILSTLYSNETF
uniref:ATP synthase subunit a n=1 Tax=Campodea lubbockii TaxID=383858 RepID=Q0ZD01_9HEXA|nr:ATP synthase F0 subunit 6 [Campodea lubbockii]ABF49579.1 ATP synthase F0 subunit 6 [Campodea lubbockii]